MSPSPLLAAKAIHKRYPGVHALKGVDIELHQGEVLALLGENGAGKSTLMKILAGHQQPDQGALYFDGASFSLKSSIDAKKHGIALIHQELQLADNLDAASNVFLGNEPTKRGLLQRQRMRSDAAELLDKLGFGLPPHTPLEGLSPGKRQLVEIARALATKARIIIMDEPTASLSQQESEKLFEVIARLRADGVSVIYISHRLHEIKQVADRVVVLRDGENAGQLPRESITHDAMVRLMVGRELSDMYQRQAHPAGEVLLEVDQLCTTTHPRKPASFSVKRGEIVGIAGLVGAGRTELLRAIAGVDPHVAGTMMIQGKNYQPHSPIDALKAGIALAPEDRKLHGLVLDLGIGSNLCLPSLTRISRAGLLRQRSAEKSLAHTQVDALHIKCTNLTQKASQLSGGNQQKIVIGKWLAGDPLIFLLDEPTRGIDIGAKREIYQLMDDLTSRGKAVLFVSSDMEEIIGVSDRVIVMHEGSITGNLTRNELNETRIMYLATGGA